MRRNNGEGSAYFDKIRGRYRFTITYADPKSQKKIRKSFYSKKTLSEAKTKARQFLTDMETQSVAETAKSLGDFLLGWLDGMEPVIKPKTWEKYKCCINCNIIPFSISREALVDLTTSKLQDHLITLLKTGGQKKTGLAPRTVNATRRLLIGALDTAVHDDVIQKNPAEYTKPMKVERPEIKILTHAQGQQLKKCALKRSRFAWAVVVLALGTGMRISEIFGLEWAKINFESKYLVVDKTVVTTRHGVLIQDSTKTNSSRRTILLPDSVCYMLKRLKLWQKVHDIRYGTNYSSQWVLSNPKGNPRSPSSFSGHDFKELLRQAGIDHSFRIHDMRHTHATWLLEAGVNVKVVSERLGHSSIRITLDTYAHALKTMQQQAVDSLNKIL